jgi:hypothetical protein
MSIRQIFEMPAMVQVEGTEDYKFPVEYTNQLCKFGDKYVLFKEKNYEEFPTSLIDIVLQAAKEDNDSISEEQLDMRMSDIVSDMTNRMESVNTNGNHNAVLTDKKIDEINNKVESISNKVKNLQSPEAVQAIVSKELTNVYENYEKVIKQLIEEKATELAKDIKDAGNKLQPMDVMMYKKMGMELPDIISLAKEGLI